MEIAALIFLKFIVWIVMGGLASLSVFLYQTISEVELDKDILFAMVLFGGVAMLGVLCVFVWKCLVALKRVVKKKLEKEKKND